MKFRDYLFVMLLYIFTLFVVLSVDLAHTRQFEALHEEVAALCETVTAAPDSIPEAVR